MDRRAFVTGLSGAAGAIALMSVLPRAAQAAPIARSRDLPLPEPVAQAASEGGRAPDGTPVERAQYYDRPPRWVRRRRRRWRRYRRRHSRLVCRRYVNRWGRWVRRCRRVWW